MLSEYCNLLLASALLLKDAYSIFVEFLKKSFVARVVDKYIIAEREMQMNTFLPSDFLII